MKIDFYTKFILTIIAITLMGLLIKPAFISSRVDAETIHFGATLDTVCGELSQIKEVVTDIFILLRKNI